MQTCPLAKPGGAKDKGGGSGGGSPGLHKPQRNEGAEGGGNRSRRPRLRLGFTLVLRWWGWPPSKKQGWAARPLTPVPKEKRLRGQVPAGAHPATGHGLSLLITELMREGSLPNGRDKLPLLGPVRYRRIERGRASGSPCLYPRQNGMMCWLSPTPYSTRRSIRLY